MSVLLPVSQHIVRDNQSLPSRESELLRKETVSVPELVFDWFGADVLSTDLISSFSPPTPFDFKPSLFSFWPVVSLNDWNNAME